MSYTLFDPSMKKDYKILIPNMLPVHFKMIVGILKMYGYNAELLENEPDREIGLKYVHNDTCYPAQVVIGQMISAIESGKYDKNKIALMITQTGGGCRASNYISLLRKALDKAGHGHIPVISINFNGLDESSFKFTLPMGIRIFLAILLGDLIMYAKNQTLPYEINKGDCDRVEDELISELSAKLTKTMPPSPHSTKKLYKVVLDRFSAIPCDRTVEKTKVGIVGEIFVKYSPSGNNDLEKFLHSQDTEVRMGGLLDFCLYCIYNNILDAKLYGMGKKTAKIYKLVYKYLLSKQNEMISVMNEYGVYSAPTPFPKVVELVNGFIHLGVKMGEGWLLTAEILELIEQGVNCVVCVQPFGCLPNHIVGKGMIKNIKEHFPNANIVPIDYDAGTSKVNQENRIKLMLADKQLANR